MSPLPCTPTRAVCSRSGLSLRHRVSPLWPEADLGDRRDRVSRERERRRCAHDPRGRVLGELAERERLDPLLRHRSRHALRLREHVDLADLPVPEDVRPDRVPVGLAVVEVGDVALRRSVDPLRVGLAEERGLEQRRFLRDVLRHRDRHHDEEQRERDRNRDEQPLRQQREREHGDGRERPDDDVVASELPDGDQGERVRKRCLVHEAAEREREHERGRNERDDVRGGPPPRCTAVEPEAEAEEEQRR